MGLEIRSLEKSPVLDDFTPLSEHQQQTPQSFYGGKPVLHAHYDDLTLAISKQGHEANPAFSKFAASSAPAVNGSGSNGRDADEVHLKDIEIWVNSEDLILFQTKPQPVGVSIPYPALALHATMKWHSCVEALYMNLTIGDEDQLDNTEDIEMLEATLLPPNFESADENTATPMKAIFEAMNTCSDLHPDPEYEDSNNGYGEDEPILGEGGWITVDNMHEFVDEDGNFIGRGNLGEGAGTVRPRVEGGENGDDEIGEDEETKWRRTE